MIAWEKDMDLLGRGSNMSQHVFMGHLSTNSSLVFCNSSCALKFSSITWCYRL